MKATIVRAGSRILVSLCIATTWQAAAPADEPANLEFFESKVRPLLAEHCQKCHGAEKQKGGLRLDSRSAVLKGGDNGPAAIPGKPAESLMVEAVGYSGDLQMPPKSRLAKEDVATINRWVEMGLPWPETSSKTSVDTKATFDIQARKQAHWAWRPIQSPPIPQVKLAAWPRDPLDAFLLAQLEAKGLTPAPDAEKRALIRRASFDITGLPPTPQEVDAFLADADPKAIEHVVDRLLASPRYGERWARHWLDLVRYGETRGHEFDPAIPNAYRYRDYLIRALNNDVPYNQFVMEHIAGDILPEPRIDLKTGVNESILATGFWFLGEEVHSPVDIRQDEADRFDNRIDVMAKTFLGLTVACARCHDHKFDAISQRDYYAFSGFLASSGYRQARYATDAADKAVAEEFEAFNNDANKKLAPLLAAAIAPAVDSLDQTLLAARASIRDSRVAASAEIQPWLAELQNAKKDATHPLHLFALASADASSSSEPSQGLQTWIRAQLESDRARTKTLADASSSPNFGKIIADYRQPATLDKLQDGYSFGFRTRQAGEVLLEPGLKGERRLFVQPVTSAHQEPSWLSAPNTAKNVHEHGRLGSWDRAGKTLRTREFRLESGTLWYLVQGPGHAYSVVDSHLMIAGPLHNNRLVDWGGEIPKWRWIRHDLSDYKGFRTHVELTANGTEPLSIALIVDSGTEPPPLLDMPNQTLQDALSKPEIDSPEDLAQGYRALFKESVSRIGVDGGSESNDLARLASWIVENRSLFLKDEAARSSLQTEVDRFFAEREAIASRIPKESPIAPAMFEGTPFDESVLIRGAAKNPGQVAPRRFLEAIAGDAPIPSDGGSGRLALARQIVDPAEPFASRVFVNRVWHHLFGRGIVASTDNFGVLGERPSHPELLDFMADRFVKEGWSVKRLIREIVISRTYQMSSRLDPDADSVDPENLLLHRMPVKRLEAEPIRDAILAISGRLNETLYGPSVPVHLTPFMEGRGRPGQSGPMDGDGRRSLYLEIRRNFLAPMMLAFDAPIPAGTIGRRNVSNVPAQALILMNDPFVVSQAALWAERTLKEPGRSVEDRVDALYKSAFARPATPEERTQAVAFLKEQAQEYQLSADAWTADKRPWADLCHVLINSKEFIYMD